MLSLSAGPVIARFFLEQPAVGDQLPWLIVDS